MEENPTWSFSDALKFKCSIRRHNVPVVLKSPIKLNESRRLNRHPTHSPVGERCELPLGREAIKKRYLQRSTIRGKVESAHATTPGRKGLESLSALPSVTVLLIVYGVSVCLYCRSCL